MKSTSLGLALTAALSFPMQACQPAPSATQSSVFQSNGVSLRYLAAGQGEPLILLHGWMGEASTWGPGTRSNPALKPPAGFRVIALDLRGHGLSDKPHDPQAYGAEMARDVVRLMDHLQIKRSHILGYSMGAYVAGKVVELAPDRVISAIYGGSAPVLSHRTVRGFALAESFAAAAQKGDMGSYVLATMPKGAEKPTPAQAQEIANQMYAGQDIKALAACGLAFGGLEVDAARMGSLKTPTLLIYGGSESQFVLDRIAEARKSLPNAEEVVIPEATHITALRSPQFSQSVVSFIKRHSMKS